MAVMQGAPILTSRRTKQPLDLPTCGNNWEVQNNTLKPLNGTACISRPRPSFRFSQNLFGDAGLYSILLEETFVMKNSILFFCAILFTSLQGYSDGPGGSLTFGANYGLGYINPGDINSISANLGATPALSNIDRSTLYSGFFGVRFLPEFEVELIYQIERATNMTASSIGSNSGFNISQNEMWIAPNYYFLLTSSVYSYFGIGIGYPLYSHVTENVGAVVKEYDANPTFGVMAQLGFGLLLGDHAAFLIKAAHEEITSGIISNSSGSLITPGGNSAVLDLSGLRLFAGLQFFL